jgi:hypothetical protein
VCKLAVSCLNNFHHNMPTSHSFTDTAENKLRLPLTFFLKHATYKSRNFLETLENHTSNKCCYLAACLFPFGRFPVIQHQLNTKELLFAQIEFRMSHATCEIREIS